MSENQSNHAHPTGQQPGATPEDHSVAGKSSVDPVLMIGATGYMGERMRTRIREAGHAVRLMVRRPGDEERFQAEGFETCVGDVLEPASLLDAMDGVGSIINLVAIIKEHGDITFEKINYQGSVNVVDAARQSGVPRLIQTSAIGASNAPDMPYLYTKWRAENYVRESGLDWTIFRPSLMFGSTAEGHEHFVSQLADVVRTAPIVPVVGGGDAKFQPIHLDDISDAFRCALEDPATVGKILEIGGPDVLTYRDMLEEIARVFKSRKPRIPVPTGLIAMGSGLLDLIPGVEPPITRDQLKILRIDNVPQENATETLIGRPPRPFRGNITYITSD
ncbi:MAG: complex I NDUFA9 subunit family protein [Chloroflexota bacterium]